MPIPFTIKVTKDILELSKRCGSEDLEIIGENCAVALAVKEIFPDVVVTGEYIHPFGIDDCDKWDDFKIHLPKIAQDFINRFDSLYKVPTQRLCLPEFEFEIMISDEIIAEINIDEVNTTDLFSESICTI